MTRLFLGALAALLLAGCAASSGEPQQSQAATETKRVYVMRHLQKGEGDDPPLTAEGAANAERLSAMLADEDIVAIFVSPTRRARETALPLAKRLRIEETIYDPRNPDALVAAVAAAPGPVLVVGHSNTVPVLVERFGGGPQPPMPEEDFGRLFVVGPDGTVEVLEVR
jgi:broad specificity phosphatase PhoE